jgi:hypothetical protein
MIYPVAGTDYTMNTASDGSGTDKTYDQAGRVLATQPTTFVGYWLLDEAVDVAGGVVSERYDQVNNLDAEAHSVVFGGTGIGDGRTSAAFDGTGSRIDFLTSAFNTNFNGELFTVGVWAKIGASEWTDSTIREIIRFEDSAINNVVIIRKTATNNELMFYYEANNTADLVTDTSLAGDTGWHFLAITVDYSNDRMRAYIDGVQVGAEQSGLGQWTAGDTTMLYAELGYSTSQATGYFLGDMAHFFVNNIEMSAAELLAIYNAQTGGFNVDAKIGGFATEFTLTNVEPTSSAFVTKLEVRGKRVRDFQPVSSEARDKDSIKLYGEMILNMDMPNQSDPLVGQDAAGHLLSSLKDPSTDVEAVLFQANRNATLIVGALAREPGDRITLTETLSGYNSNDFFINAVRLHVYPIDQIECEWTLVPVADSAFWAIGTAGLSEIGQTTYVTY